MTWEAYEQKFLHHHSRGDFDLALGFGILTLIQLQKESNMNEQQILDKLAALKAQIDAVTITQPTDLTAVGTAIDDIAADVTAKFPPSG